MTSHLNHHQLWWLGHVFWMLADNPKQSSLWPVKTRQTCCSRLGKKWPKGPNHPISQWSHVMPSQVKDRAPGHTIWRSYCAKNIEQWEDQSIQGSRQKGRPPCLHMLCLQLKLCFQHWPIQPSEIWRNHVMEKTVIIGHNGQSLSVCVNQG